MGLASLCTWFILSLLVSLCFSDDKLAPGKPLIFPGKLISNDGVFALGFFSPTNSSSRFYIGIWYNNIPDCTVVWVANRNNPITNPSSAALVVNDRSDIALSDHEGRIYWTTTNNITTRGAASRASLALLNEGNLVLRSPNGTVLWQSFDHPTDTILPGMPVRMNLQTRFTECLVSWKGPEDPSTGNFSLCGDVNSGIQLFMLQGSRLYWRSTAWDGKILGSTYKRSYNSIVIIVRIVASGDDISLTYVVSKGSPDVHTRMAYMGKYEFRIWNRSALAWTVLQTYPGSGCDHYASCGPFGYCDATEAIPMCKCPDGFDPNGSTTPPSGGCSRKESLRCGGEDQFVVLQDMKTPAFPVFVRNRSFDGCAAECQSNCSCTAYAYSNLSSAVSGGDLSRCLLWFGELVDMGRKYPNIDSEDLYLRLAGAPGT